MATKWSAVSISGYGDLTPSDDGAATEANKVKYSTIKTDLTNPLNTALSSALTGLTEAFNDATIAKSGTYSTTATDHARTIECTSTFTLSLLAAATAGAGYRVTVKNAGTGVITVARSSTDTINGATSQTLYPKDTMTYVVNAAGNGYDAIGNLPATVLLDSKTASTSSSLVFALDTNYDTFILELLNIKPVTDGTNLDVTLSSDGSTYFSASYAWTNDRLNSAATASPEGSASDSSIQLMSNVGNVDGEQCVGTVRIHSVSGMGTRLTWNVSAVTSSSVFVQVVGAGVYAGAAASYLKLLASSGDLSGGTARLYGVRKS